MLWSNLCMFSMVPAEHALLVAHNFMFACISRYATKIFWWLSYMSSTLLILYKCGILTVIFFLCPDKGIAFWDYWIGEAKRWTWGSVEKGTFSPLVGSQNIYLDGALHILVTHTPYLPNLSSDLIHIWWYGDKLLELISTNFSIDLIIMLC
jgi:hypothetical protein